MGMSLWSERFGTFTVFMQYMDLLYMRGKKGMDILPAISDCKCPSINLKVVVAFLYFSL